ncbi:MAG: TIGR04552 family protein [Bdellovibrionia bacterium]
MNPLPGATLRKKYNFRTDILDIIIGGKSTIDSPHPFQIFNLNETHLFIKSYGYDLDNPIENAELFGNFHEAVSFIRKHFLKPENPNGLKLEIPRKILELTNIKDLFSMIGNISAPAQPEGMARTLQNWTCSILKVMHTIAHIDKDLRSSYFAEIQKQIFDRFYKSIHRDSEGKLFFGETEKDPLRVDLVAFETKPKKSRESITLKLLHKPENVAEDIFDRVGVRFITHTRLDALRVIKYLKEKMIIMAPNIKPSRSRNTLVPIDAFKSELETLLPELETGALSEKKFIEKLERIPFSSANADNPHSSEHYKAIQFTCRQLIKLSNPLYADLRDLKALVKNRSVDDDILKTIEKIDLKYTQREIRFFYPFEVQVMDQKSAEENEKGRSAHSEYKRSQVLTAMKRVMGALVDEAR